MRVIHIRWLIILGCCITVIESVYQLSFFLKLHQTELSHSECDHSEDTLSEGFAYYQFQYGHACVTKNRKFKEFFTSKGLKQAENITLEFIEEVSKSGGKSHLIDQYISLTILFILILDPIHIASSLLLYWASYAPTWNRKVIMLTIVPWGIISIIITLADIVISTLAIYVFLYCQKPSTCILWNEITSHQQQYERFDEYALPGSQLYGCIMYMPKRFLIIGCKHIFGSPLLMVIMGVLLYQYKHQRILITPPDNTEELTKQLQMTTIN